MLTKPEIRSSIEFNIKFETRNTILKITFSKFYYKVTLETVIKTLFHLTGKRQWLIRDYYFRRPYFGGET